MKWIPHRLHFWVSQLSAWRESRACRCGLLDSIAEQAVGDRGCIRESALDGTVLHALIRVGALCPRRSRLRVVAMAPGGTAGVGLGPSGRPQRRRNSQCRSGCLRPLCRLCRGARGSLAVGASGRRSEVSTAYSTAVTRLRTPHSACSSPWGVGVVASMGRIRIADGMRQRIP